MHATDPAAILRSIADNMPGAIIFALDGGYRYTYFNALHHAVMGQIWGADIAVGVDMLGVIGRDDDRAKARANFDRALAGEAFTLVEAYGDEELQRSYWQNVYAPVRAGDGAVVGLTVQVTDITAREQAEARARAQQLDLERIVGERTAALEEKIALIQALSAPIIRVWDGVLVVPLIGALGDSHAIATTTAVLAEIQRSSSRTLLVDITGLRAVDATAADHLLRMNRAARLLGAECALVGVSPEVARSLVALEVPLAGLKTFASLHDGLRAAIHGG